jgi:NAD(P)-dependent dehydrogenase (short-subunit alcohol dehydrogenase family)
VISGASTGIGEATALRLAAAGYEVFAGVRKPADGDALREKSGGKIRPLQLDVTDRELIEAAVKEVGAAVGERGIQGLVNNAGISLGSPIEFSSEDEIRQTFEINVFGLLSMTRAFLPLIRKGGGRIVCTGSISGRTGVPFVGTYSASKAAVRSICESLRVELRPWGIEVALVEPGSIATPIWEKGLQEFDQQLATYPQEAIDLYGELIPRLRALTERTGRAGISPDRVAQAVQHALSARRPKTRYLVGNDARAQATLRVLPDRAREAALARFIGMPAKGSRAPNPG